MQTILRPLRHKSCLSILALGMLACTSSAQIDLASFGSTSLTVDPVSTTATYTQTASGITFQPSVSFGDTLGGEFIASAYNWSAYNPTSPGIAWFAKVSILSGANPNLPFTLNLIDTVAGTSLNLDGDTTGATSGSYIALTLNPTDPGSASALSSVNFVQLTWNNGGNLNVSVEGVAAVPEPSTYALLALGGLALGGYVMRRRQRA